MRKRVLCLVMAAGLLCGGAGIGRAQTTDAARNVFLQTIGLLAGQGLVLGYTNLDGIAARFEKRQLPKNKALTLLEAARRYTELTLAAFSERLMPRLAEGERQDLKLLIGYYEIQRGAVVALTDFVRTGAAKDRQAFEEMQHRVAAVIRQIALTPAGEAPKK